MFLSKKIIVLMIILIIKKLFKIFDLICISFKGRRFHLIPQTGGHVGLFGREPTKLVLAVYKLWANIHKFVWLISCCYWQSANQMTKTYMSSSKAQLSFEPYFSFVTEKAYLFLYQTTENKIAFWIPTVNKWYQIANR